MTAKDYRVSSGGGDKSWRVLEFIVVVDALQTIELYSLLNGGVVWHVFYTSVKLL